MTILVCGLGRCGSSLMMQMLSAGGLQCAGRYPMFEHMPAGAPITIAMLEELAGGAAKLLNPHMITFEPGCEDKAVVLWMDRNAQQQALSQAKICRMLYSAYPADVRAFAKHLGKERQAALGNLSRFTQQAIWFDGLINDPVRSAVAVANWLSGFGFCLDVEKMVQAVRPRSAKCLDGFLEDEL